MSYDIKPHVRFAVLERDSFRCRYCGTSADDARLQIDHIIPRAKGGTNEICNLLTACYPCNIGKMAKTIDRFPIYEANIDGNTHRFASTTARELNVPVADVYREAIEEYRYNRIFAKD
jgi:hypothetical protein